MPLCCVKTRKGVDVYKRQSQIRAEEDAANEIEQIEIDRLQEGSEKVLRHGFEITLDVYKRQGF